MAAPWRITKTRPTTPIMTSTATLTAALTLFTHLLSDIGRMPMATITQMRAMTMISSQVRLMPPQNAAARVPAKITNTAGAQ